MAVAVFALCVSSARIAAGPQVESVGALVVPRQDHTATVLTDGRVLVIGGQDSTGALASAEVYDPSTRQFSLAGRMNTARIGHAATLLGDGRVLVTGGQTGAAVLASAEIYDATAQQFQLVAATLTAPRSGHTATLLSDGQVLIAGGDSTGTAERFDPGTSSFSSPLPMVARRSGHAASTLGDRFIFFTGGGNNSVELFDAHDDTFSPWPKTLTDTRTGHAAVTASDDSVVLIGGDRAGTLERLNLENATGSAALALGGWGSAAHRLANERVLVLGSNLAALFNSAENTVSAIDGAELLQRRGQTTSELLDGKHILVAGGSDGSATLVPTAALYYPARIETDKEDYYPEDPVIVTGSGWKAGEEVDLFVVDSEGWVYDSTAVADAAGQFLADPYFVVLWQHLGVEFKLTALGAESGLLASHSFTDSPKVGSVTIGAQTGTVTYGTPAAATFSIVVSRGSGPGSSGRFDATLTVTSGLPAGATASFSENPVSIASHLNTSPTVTLSLNTSASTPAGTYMVTVRAAASEADFAQATGTLTIGAAMALTGNFTAANKIYDGTTNATIQTRSLNGVIGSDDVTLVGGLAQFADKNVGQDLAVTGTGFTLTGVDAHKYTLGSVSATTATISPRGLTGSFTAEDKVYDGTTTATIVERSLSGVIGDDSVALTGGTAEFSDANAGVNKLVSGTGFTLGGSDAGNYILDTVSSPTAAISKAEATIVVNGYNDVYDGAAHGASGTTSGVNGEALVGLDLGASFSNVPGGTAHWAFTDVTGNYLDANGSVEIVITKANAIFSVTGYTGTYDGAAHGASGSAIGVLGETLAGLDLGASFTNVPGGTAHWTFSDITGNYLDASGSVAIVISKASATVHVTGYTGTYDGAAHGASGSAIGVLGETLAGLDLGASFTNVPGGTVHWAFSDATGNYLDASGSVAIVISKASATVHVTGYTGTYDGAPHGASGSAIGVLGETLAGLDLGATFTNVPGGTVHWAFSDATGNYLDASGSVAIVISKASATVHVTGYTGMYDGAPHGASGSAIGVLGETLAGLDLGATFTNVPGGTANWAFSDVTGNYLDASGSVAIVISKASATVNVTGYSGTYDGAAHGASGSAIGVLGETLAGLDLGASFTNVPGGTANWAFADITGNYLDASGSVAIVISKASATVDVTGYSGMYDGSAHGASGSAIGALGETLAGLDLGASFSNVPGGTAHWTFADVTGNYNDANGSVEIVITKANAILDVSGYSGTYDGLAHGASGSASGVSGEVLAGLDLGASFINVPGGTANWAFTDVTGNYLDASGSVAIVISKASATVHVTGYSGMYDGSAHGASGSAIGVLGETLAGLDLGASFTNVPGGTADWAFTDVTGNYLDASGSVAIVISKASATVHVTGYTGTYDGSAHGASGSAIGVLGETLAGLDLGASFTNVPGGTANWAFADITGNYLDASGSVAIVISKASATVHVTGYTGTYDGAPHGASGSALGVFGETLVGLDFGASFSKVPGGTAHWTFADVTGNYNDANGSVEIVITKANAILNVSGYSGTYDGLAHGASGSASGVSGEVLAGLDLGASFTNVPGGTAHWTFSDVTGNYLDASESVAIVINPRPLTITANSRTKAFGNTVVFDGTEFSSSGLLDSDQVASVVLTSAGAAAAATAAGSPYPIVATNAAGSGLGNYAIAYVDGSLTVMPLDFVGFLAPIGGAVETGNGGSYADPLKSFKLGSTVPVKVRIFNQGALVTTGVHTLKAIKYSNAITSDVPIDATPTDAATSGNQLRAVDGEWHFNLSTKSLTSGTWKLVATLADGTTHEVWIALKK
jgi:hypothetical protein